MDPVTVLDWGDGLIRCHQHDLTARRFSDNGLYGWQPRERGDRLFCSFCGSVHPQWVWETFAPIRPSRPPWFVTCTHLDHHTAVDFRECERQQLDAIASWVGMEVADWKYGHPHKIYLYAPRTNGIGQSKFYAAHLLDLPDPAFAALTEVITAHTGIRYRRSPAGARRALEVEVLPPAWPHQGGR